MVKCSGAYVDNLPFYQLLAYVTIKIKLNKILTKSTFKKIYLKLVKYPATDLNANE